jgi:hypothetical protein
MEIRAGITYLKEIGLLVGASTGPIAEKNINEYTASDLYPQLATKIMMIHITTIDARACIPYMYFPTTTATTTEMKQKVLFLLLLQHLLHSHHTLAHSCCTHLINYISIFKKKLNIFKNK